MRWIVITAFLAAIFGVVGFFGPIGGRGPASTGDSVWLMVGDSHTVGAFGSAFYDKGSALNLFDTKRFYQYGVIGSSADNWTQGDFANLKLGYSSLVPPLAKESKKGAPDTVWKLNVLEDKLNDEILVVALGTNDMAQYIHLMKNSKSETEQNEFIEQAAKLLQAHHAKTCFWVLPTLMKGNKFPADTQNKFLDKLKSNLSSQNCVVIDSREFTISSVLSTAKELDQCHSTSSSSVPLLPDGTDGIHFTPPLAKIWGECVALTVQKDLLEKPAAPNSTTESPHPQQNGI